MLLTKHPRALARIGGGFYLLITACALFAYLYVRGQLIVPGDMAGTASNIMTHEPLCRLGAAAAVIVVMANLPLGLIMYELLKIVNRPLALLALLFIVASATLEAVNVLNYISPLIILDTPEYANAFDPAQVQALARGPIRFFGPGFSVALSFFGVFCLLAGYLITRSRFFPTVLGVLMMVKGGWYVYSSFSGFLGSDVPNIPLWIHLIPENAFALWLLLIGLNESEWQEQSSCETIS